MQTSTILASVTFLAASNQAILHQVQLINFAPCLSLYDHSSRTRVSIWSHFAYFVHNAICPVMMSVKLATSSHLPYVHPALTNHLSTPSEYSNPYDTQKPPSWLWLEIWMHRYLLFNFIMDHKWLRVMLVPNLIMFYHLHVNSFCLQDCNLALCLSLRCSCPKKTDNYHLPQLLLMDIQADLLKLHTRSPSWKFSQYIFPIDQALTATFSSSLDLPTLLQLSVNKRFCQKSREQLRSVKNLMIMC